jgi:hypothetical protein
MAEDKEKSQNDASAEGGLAKHPTDDDENQESKDKDAAVDEASEQSMDGSDAPSW